MAVGVLERADHQEGRRPDQEHDGEDEERHDAEERERHAPRPRQRQGGGLELHLRHPCVQTVMAI